MPPFHSPQLTSRHRASPSAFSLPDALIVLTIRRCAARTSGATATVICHTPALTGTPFTTLSVLVNEPGPGRARCDFPGRAAVIRAPSSSVNRGREGDPVSASTCVTKLRRGI